MNQPVTVSMRTRQPVKTGNQRVLELLAELKTGLCGRCGRARYATRGQARRAARIAVPGRRLRAYRCGDVWHLTSHSRPQWIAAPVTLASAPATSSKPTKTPAPQSSLRRMNGTGLTLTGETSVHPHMVTNSRPNSGQHGRSTVPVARLHTHLRGRERGDRDAFGPISHAEPDQDVR